MLNLLKNNNEFCILDTETTGLNPQNGDRIIEIAVYNIITEESNYFVKDKFVTYINPERSIPYFITKMTGISDFHVIGAPRFFEIADNFLNFIYNKILVIQNVGFDMKFLNRELELVGYNNLSNKTIDTIMMSRKIFKKERKHNLDAIASRLNISKQVSRHSAEGDVIITTEAFVKMRNIILNS
ncbi:3'-5' exonuclease [Marinitoga aeolica]|uniref:3'-5' exonuclease n=1 Tax=Marinitoga aeolica TaxID=2809031 RepID=A0ABY8PS91_9BACT|nr:3'-5' exonuclease [Marinitoga aeolica]WGS65488.1 3'-5' exonuclease [Marinitoga aeolica]